MFVAQVFGNRLKYPTAEDCLNGFQQLQKTELMQPLQLAHDIYKVRKMF